MTEAKLSVDGDEMHYVVEDDDREPIDSAEQLPKFTSEAEEQQWWRTHAFSERFWHEGKPVPEDKLPRVRPESGPDGRTLPRRSRTAKRG
jgi:hypothetical protein